MGHARWISISKRIPNHCRKNNMTVVRDAIFKLVVKILRKKYALKIQDSTKDFWNHYNDRHNEGMIHLLSHYD